MTDPPLRIVSCGAGVQSTTIALLMRDGRLPLADHAIFADTGWEPAHVYRQVDRLAALFAELGVKFHPVSAGDLRRDAVDPAHRYTSVPYHLRNTDGTKAMGRRQCTNEYKLAPINRKVRELLGATPPRFQRVPKGRYAEQWIGFTTDEIGRVRESRVSYQRLRYPLLELGWSRAVCQRYLDDAGWGETAKSACIGCPLHGNRQWRELRTRPDEWADAVAFDESIRNGAAGARRELVDGQAFLHHSRVPLAVAVIDTRSYKDTRAEQADVQLDLFAEGGDPGGIDPEEGAPDGCSPYGCRSGGPA